MFKLKKKQKEWFEITQTDEEKKVGKKLFWQETAWNFAVYSIAAFLKLL